MSSFGPMGSSTILGDSENYTPDGSPSAASAGLGSYGAMDAQHAVNVGGASNMIASSAYKSGCSSQLGGRRRSRRMRRRLSEDSEEAEEKAEKAENNKKRITRRRKIRVKGRGENRRKGSSFSKSKSKKSKGWFFF